jgi:hypothetical protein
MNILESLTGQGFGSRSFNKNNADSANNNPNTEICHCQSLDDREYDSCSVTIAAIALDVNNDGGRASV